MLLVDDVGDYNDQNDHSLHPGFSALGLDDNDNDDDYNDYDSGDNSDNYPGISPLGDSQIFSSLLETSALALLGRCCYWRGSSPVVKGALFYRSVDVN